MNRFLNKKKGGDEPLTPPQAAKKWRKGKKTPVLEQKPQLDLTAALPSTDDFRTSLIMPTLSTRFSMLREQDDPTTKMGKASDDSVLQPQRSSRLLDFGFSSNPLNDIAEVASMKSSIRPPFASSEKHSSYASEEGYGTDGDSNNNGNMMSRARPGEGNILFGGRQKVYKIATGSTKSLGGTGGGNMGKVVYEDDVNMSAFQRYRQQQQREAAAAAAAAAVNDEQLLEHEIGSRESLASTHHSEDQSQVIGLGLTHSPSVTAHHDTQRLSSSTTTSVPSQGNTSTAATSVASQSIGNAVTTSTAQHSTVTASVSTAISPAPAPIAERSLSKRRLYEHGLEKNLYEQQASTMTRLNSLQRNRSPTVGSVGSAPVLHHSQSIGHLHERGFQPYALQTSLQPTGKAFPPLAIHKSPPNSHPQSPLSPTMSESEEYKTLHSALEPGDRGKATAMGAFNRPRQQYDEEQYMQRQAQLHQSNQSSMSRKNSVDVLNQPDSRLGRSDSARQTPDPRARSASVSASPKVEQSASQPFSVFQNAAIQNRVIHGENPNLPPAAPLPPAPTMADTHRTFFGDISASEDEEDEEDDIVSDFEQSTPQYVPNNFMTGSGNGRFTPTSLASVSEHPAVRHETPNIPEVDEEEEEEPIIPAAQLHMTTSDIKDTTAAEPENTPQSSGGYKEVDSPTIGGKDGLSSLIYHLRKSSDQSSIYPPVAQSHPDMVDNAWDLDDLENYYGDAIGNRPSSQTGSTVAKGQPLGPAGSKANIYPSRPSTRDSDTIDGSLWQNDFKKQHTRDTSTATQAERQAFDEELAARQRAIQEKMRNLVENESRATSPGPSAGGALKAFGMLKSKPSQEAISRDGSSKALKKLGLGAPNSQQGKSPTYEEPAVNAWVPTSNPQWPLPGPKEQKTMASPPVQQTQTMQPVQAAQRSPPQKPKTRDGTRSRSNSSAFGSRSRSRTNGYRDDFGGPPDVPQLLSARPSMETMHSITPPSLTEQVRGRLRSNSKQASYFDHEPPPHHGFMGTPSGRMTPGGVSPGSALSMTQTGSSNTAPRPSYTTPSSSYGSKNGSGPSAAHVATTVRPAGSLLRKRTINKADIGEPTLISSTSNVDTVDLPTARTLAHPPLLPILNPRRRVYTHGDATMSAGEVSRNAFSPPPIQHAATFASGPGPRMSMRSPSVRQSVEDLSSQFDAVGSPMMNEAGMF